MVGLGFALGFALGIGIGAIILWCARPKRAYQRLPWGWTMVSLKHPFDLDKMQEISTWLDEHCVVLKANANNPYKKSNEWFLLDCGNNYAIKDPDVAFQFKIRWA